jgi:hypothetical protein
MSTDRRDLLRMGALLLALLAATGLILALTSGSGGGGTPAGGAQGTMDGILTTVSAQELVLRRSDGGGDQRFVVRDPRQLDLFHLETHARDQLPSRVFFVRDGDALYAVRVEDL